jgi:hypothetical protein
MEVCSRVLQMVHSYGGRFLKRDKDESVTSSSSIMTSGDTNTNTTTTTTSLAGTRWTDVGDTYAREKVTHALRSAKDPNRIRMRKPRVSKAYEPTDRDTKSYEEAIDYQTRLFEWLLKEHEKGTITELELETSNACIRQFEQATQTSCAIGKSSC